jgi:hypothetical protein
MVTNNKGSFHDHPSKSREMNANVSLSPARQKSLAIQNPNPRFSMDLKNDTITFNHCNI